MSKKAVLKLINDLYDVNRDTKSRTHLGASLIGRNCTRAVWYSYNKFSENTQIPRLFRLFETGNITEDRIIFDLKKTGYKITDEQRIFRYKKTNFGGSVDGIIVFEKRRHVLEIKTHNQKSFSDLIKCNVKISKYQHFCQMQVYMHLSKIKKSFYLAVNKNTDEIYCEIIDYNEKIATNLCEKAEIIIAVDTAPARISPERFGENWYECKMCSYSNTCYSKISPKNSSTADLNVALQ